MSVKNQVKGEVLVINANDIFDQDFIKKFALKAAGNKKVLLTGKKISEYFPGGYFKIDDCNNPIGIIEKPNPENIPSNTVRLVVDYFPDIDLLIQKISQIVSKSDDKYEKAINLVLDESDKSLEIYQGNWTSLKYPWHVLSMMRMFFSSIVKNDIDKTARISEKAIITGPVIIRENVVIGDFAKIVGPVYLGPNTVISDYSMVRDSQIGQDCLIGSYSEVARSYIGNKVFLHRNYIGDSVIGNDVMFGAGAVTANLRFDSKTVFSVSNGKKVDSNMNKLGAIVGNKTKIGVESAILPGVKIGGNCIVAPNETVRSDLEDYTYLARSEEKNNIL